MKTLKSALIFCMVLSLMFWGYPVNAQQITDLSNNSATIIPAVTTSTTWVKPAATVTIPNIAPTVTTIPTVQAASTLQNFNISQAVQQLLSLKYGVTSDVAYTDLGGIQARQAEIFDTSSDCLDRAVYLLNLGNELGLDASISILYDSLTGTGHALVGMDDGAGGRTMYDLTSDSGTVSLSDYVDKGFEVVAEVDSLEGLTTVINGINGAYNIADDEGDGGDDGGVGNAGETGSWGDSRNDGGGMGSYSNDGYGGYSDTATNDNNSYNSSPAENGDSADYNYYADVANNAANFFNAMSHGDYAGMMSASFGMAHDMSVISTMNSLGSSGADFATAMNRGDVFGMINASNNMSHSMSTLNGLLSQSNSQNSWGSNANPITTSATFNYGQHWANSSRDGNQVTITQNWVGKDGKTYSQDVMSGTIGQNGHYELTDTKGNVASSGTWSAHTEQNLLNSMTDPGHQVISSPNGDQRDVDLSDGSYVITNGNQTLGSGSKGALNINYSRNEKTGGIEGKLSAIDNLQVYAVDLKAGHGGVPQEAVSLIASLPGGLEAATHNTYIGSKNGDTTAYYQNVYTGKTVTVNDQTRTTAGQYSWLDASGQLISSVNVSAKTTTTQPRAADASAQKTVTLTALESQLKTAASQQGSRVTSIVSSSGVTYTVWNESWDKHTSSVVISGKRDYSFEYDKQGNALSGKVTAYDFNKGTTQSATIDQGGKYTAAPQAQLINAEQSRVTTNPRTLDGNQNASNSQNTIEAQNQSFSKTALSLIPTIGLTDTIMTNKSAAPEEIKDTQENKGFGIAQWFVDLTKATLPTVQGENAFKGVANMQVSTPVETKESTMAANVSKDNPTPGILDSFLSSFEFTGFGLTDTITSEKHSDPQEIKDTTENKSLNSGSLLATSVEKLTSFYAEVQNIANGVRSVAETVAKTVDAAEALGREEQKTDLVGSVLNGLSAVEDRVTNAISAYRDNAPDRAAVIDISQQLGITSALQPVTSNLAVNFAANSITQQVGVTIKADLGQKSAELKQQILNEYPESERPAVQSALDKIGPNNLDRFAYAPNILVSLVDNHRNAANDTRPLAVMLVPSTDYPGAFVLTGNIIDLTAHGYNVQYYEVSNTAETKDALLEATNNGAKPAEVLVIASFGDQRQIALGTLSHVTGGTISVYDKAALKDLQGTLAEDGAVVIYSPSSGKGGTEQLNVVNLFADVFPQADVVAGQTKTSYGFDFQWGGVSNNAVTGVDYYSDLTYDARHPTDNADINLTTDRLTGFLQAAGYIR